MEPFGGELAVRNDAPATAVLEDKPQEKFEQEQLGQQQASEQNEDEREYEIQQEQHGRERGQAYSSQGQHEQQTVSENSETQKQTSFSDGRRRRGFAGFPLSATAEGCTVSGKRKRTPSRRVEEAAESALLLEQVLAEENSATFREAAAKSAAPSQQQQCCAGVGGGSVAARVAALRDALFCHREQFYSANTKVDRQKLSGAQGGGKGILGEGGFQSRGRLGEFLQETQRGVDDQSTREIPQCRRSSKQERYKGHGYAF